MSEKTMMVNVLLTRRCNLRCGYCDIVRDYTGMPESYPKVADIKDRTAEEWVSDFKSIQKFYKDRKDLFFILYGGEPFLFSGLNKLLMYMDDNNMNYTIITNGTLPGLFEQVQDLRVRGLSCSIDPMSFIESGDSSKKAAAGFSLLKKVKAEMPTCDCTAEIVVNNDNVFGLVPLVKSLSEMGVWSSITIAECKKNPFYDFASVNAYQKASSDEVKKKLDFLYDLTEAKLVKVHVPKILKWLKSVMPMENKDCGLLENSMTIEPDGRLRLCLRIRGVCTPQFKVEDLDEKIFSICAAQEGDYEKYCEGCAWTCPMMPQLSDSPDEIAHKEVKVV